jgi:phage gp29-like protein
LGGTLTSQADGKSSTNALGNVHNEVRHDLLVSDAMQIASSLSRFIKLICQVNGWQGRTPKFVFDTTESEDLAQVDSLIKLSENGVKIPLSYIHKKFKIPVAKRGEEILTATQQPMPAQNNAAMSALSANLPVPTFTPAQQGLESLVAASVENIPAPLSSDDIRNAVFSANSMVDLEANLALLLDKQDPRFTELLAQTAFSAQLLGFVNASESVI